MCCQYFSYSCKIRTICMCDETKWMTERFFSYMAVGFLRDCEFVMFVVIVLSLGDLSVQLKIVLIRFGIYTYMHYIYIYICFIYMCMLSIHLWRYSPFWALAFPRRCFHSSVFCSFTHTDTHTHTHTHIYIYI